MSMNDLFKARLRVRILEDEVEKPMNVHRWRALEVSKIARSHYCYDYVSISLEHRVSLELIVLCVGKISK